MKFTLNGKEIEYSGNLSARLLDVLRDEYRLTGVKCGCKEGECGACAVIMDGEAYTSSHVLGKPSPLLTILKASV